MVNRILYWFVTLPSLTKFGCASILSVFVACNCLIIASMPEAYARQAEMQTATVVRAQQQATAEVIAAAESATAQRIADVTSTRVAQEAATATRVVAIRQITATALAAPTVTAQAYLDATATSIAGVTATAQADLDATSTAVAIATEQAAVALTAEARAQEATATAQARAAAREATAQAIAQATAVIEGYREAMPKGWWEGSGNGIGVVVGNFRYTRSTGFYRAGSGAAFVAFGISVYNHSGSEIHVNPLNVTLVDLEGRTYAPELMGAADYWSEPLNAVDVLDGNKASGGMLFTIDADSAPAQIVYETNVLFGDKIIIDLRRPPDQTPTP